MIKESCGNKELRILIVNIRILKHEEAFNEFNKIKLYIPLGITKRIRQLMKLIMKPIRTLTRILTGHCRL